MYKIIEMNLETLVEQQKALNCKLINLLDRFELVVIKLAGEKNDGGIKNTEIFRNSPSGIIEELYYLQEDNNELLNKLEEQLEKINGKVYMEYTSENRHDSKTSERITEEEFIKHKKEVQAQIDAKKAIRY